jgi:hypothetical protein
MNKYPLIGGSICAIVLIVLASMNNIVGYQTVKASNQKIITTEFDEKELLFQTIADMANNKEIQKVILESQSKFPTHFPTTQFTSVPTITKKQLNFMYNLGVVLSKTMGKVRIESLAKKHPINTQVNDKINSIIGNNTKLKEEMAQLSTLNCSSCSESTDNRTFPVLCVVLYFIYLPLYLFGGLTAILIYGLASSGEYLLELLLYFIGYIFIVPLMITIIIGKLLNCYWWPWMS